MGKHGKSLTRKGFLKVAGAFTGGAVLTACGGGPTGTPVAEESPAIEPTSAPTVIVTPAAPAEIPLSKTLVIGIETEPYTYDPITYTSNSDRTYVRNMYEGLTDVYGEDMYAKPCLATDWTISDDGLEYVFNLRQGVKFHDGTDFGAEAVKLSIEAYKEGKGRWFPYCPNVDHVEVVDDYTAKLVLSAPYAGTIEGLQWWPIFSPTAYKQFTTDDERLEWFNVHSAGTGPYYAERWDPGEQIVFGKFDDYWGGWDGPHVERVIGRVMNEAATQRLLLEEGELDFSQKIAVEAVQALQDNPDIRMEVYPIARIFSVMMNLKKPPTDNPKVREAIAWAFDYDAHNKVAMQGYAGDHPGGPIPLDLLGNEVPEGMAVRKPRDVAKAKALLAEAGYPNGGLDIDMVYIGPMFVEHEKLATVMYNSLAEIGINLNAINCEPAAWRDTMMNFDKSVPLWCHYASCYAPIADQYLWYLYHTDAQGEKGNNWSYFSDPEVDQLIETAWTKLDPAEYVETVKDAAVRIEDYCPAVRVNRTMGFEAARTWVKGWIPRPFLLLSQKYYELYLEGKPD